MATAIEETDNSILICTLCNGELKKPKLLPCQHSFCSQCLVKHYDGLSEGKPFCCPTCHKDIQLKDDTIERLPDNYLFDIVKDTGGIALKENLRCVPCSQGNKSTKATHKCLDCRDILCQQCNEWHCRFTATKHHVVYPIKDLQKGKIQEQFIHRRVKYCGLHSKDDLKIPLSSYCDTCQCLVCLGCIQGDHNGHIFAKIHEKRESHQRYYDDNLFNLERSKRDHEKRIENISEVITDTKQQWSRQETDIYDTATQIYALVDIIKDEKLTELKVQYEKELQYLNDLWTEEKNKLSCLQITVSFANMFLEKSSDSDFLCLEGDVGARIEDSQQGKCKRLTRNIAAIEKQETESITQAIEEVFGRIEIKEEVITHKWKIGEVKEKFRKKIKMDEVSGLALHNQNIIVIGEPDDIGILVLNECGNYSRTIDCHNATHSCDIDVAADQLFLTVGIEGEREVKVLTLDGGLIKSVRLPEDDQESDERMVIVTDNEGTMFVSSYDMDRIYKIGRDEETCSTLISSDFDEHLYGPAYLCLTPTGELVACNIGSSNIEIYSQEGELLWQYDGEEEGNELANPSGMCCDKDGYIYVLDTGNSRIQVIHDSEIVGNIPINEEVDFGNEHVPLTVTPEKDLIYAYGNNLVKIAFMELE